MTAKEYEEGWQLLVAKWRENFENCFNATDSDLVVASGESVMTTAAMAAGYPVAGAPLGFANFNGRPFGIEIVA
jgi:amidase